jgi:hypothetical protein
MRGHAVEISVAQFGCTISFLVVFAFVEVLVMHQGYVCVWRKLKDSFFYADSEAVHLWVHLLISANHKDKSFLFNGKKIVVKRGQFITGLNKLQAETKISQNKIYRVLNVLKSEKLIEKQSNNKFSIITILNYNEHQNNEKLNEKPVENKRKTNEKPVETTNNEKECISTKKNEKKEEEGEFFCDNKDGNPRTPEEVIAELERNIAERIELENMSQV